MREFMRLMAIGLVVLALASAVTAVAPSAHKEARVDPCSTAPTASAKGAAPVNDVFLIGQHECVWNKAGGTFKCEMKTPPEKK